MASKVVDRPSNRPSDGFDVRLIEQQQTEELEFFSWDIAHRCRLRSSEESSLLTEGLSSHQAISEGIA